MSVQANLEKTHAAGSTMRGMLEAAKEQVVLLTWQW